MIKVKVSMHGIFKEYGEQKEFLVELQEGAEFRILMEKLIEILGERFKREVYVEMEYNENLHRLVFLNNKNLFVIGGMKNILKDGDHIMFLPPMAGG